MVLIRYVLTRFFSYLFLINIGLTLLYNLIEFFEKMVRTKHTTTEAIFVFIALNIVPSFFENLPIASWLASCMTLKEMHQQNEWETLRLLNVPLRTIFSSIAIAGAFLVLFSFVGKELVTNRIAQAASHFKQEQFKHKGDTKLFNKWFALPEQKFCHFSYADLTKNQGREFSLIELSNSFKMEKIVLAPTFLLDQTKQTISFPQSTTLVSQTRTLLDEQNSTLTIPSFFTQLSMKQESPSLAQMFRLVIFSKNSLPDYVYHQLLYLFLTRLLAHLLLLLYPLLTFMLFFLFPYHRYYRWILIFVPYPFVVLLLTMSDSLMQTVQHGLLAIIPYVILTLCVVGLGKNYVLKTS